MSAAIGLSARLSFEGVVDESLSDENSFTGSDSILLSIESDFFKLTTFVSAIFSLSRIGWPSLRAKICKVYDSMHNTVKK